MVPVTLSIYRRYGRKSKDYQLTLRRFWLLYFQLTYSDLKEVQQGKNSYILWPLN